MRFLPLILLCGAASISGCSASDTNEAGSAIASTDQVDEAKPSTTLNGEAGYLAVKSRWIEKPDVMYGPKKMLVYMAKSADYNNTLLFSCENAHQIAVVTLGGAANTMNYDADATVRFGTQEPEKVKFVARAGEFGLHPGDGSPEAATDFLSKVADANEVAVKFDTVMGMASSDPAMLFKSEGAKEVDHNLQLACKAQQSA